jgi:prevent-host-death family protein
MKVVSISVTDAARNFSDVVNRVRYQQTSFVLLKSGKAVARIVPEVPRLTKGRELASALREALKETHLTPNDAKAWLRDLEESRREDRPPVAKWPS